MGFLSDLKDSFTGAGDRKAARRATRQQIRAEQEAQEQLIELNRPFVELGTNNISRFQETFLDDPTGATFLEGNPLFEAAVDNANRATLNLSAAQGRANSGGVIDELFKNYLAIGDDFVNSAFSRSLTPIQMGQNAANFQGTNVGNSLTNQGAARAAGSIATQNARNQGFNNLLNLGSTVLQPLGGAIGGLFGGLFGGGGGSGGRAIRSDVRLKENLEEVGVRNGLPLYEFNYIGEEGRYRGHIAQDIQKVDPDSVTEVGGYLMVTQEYAPELI